jgi:hypothetical protein
MASKNTFVSPAKRVSCVTVFGSFSTNRKSPGVCCAHDTTVWRPGVA